jgi:hypothetical protein
MLEPIVSTPQRNRRRAAPSGPSRGYIAAVSLIVVVIVVLIALLLSGGGSSGKKGPARATAIVKAPSTRHHARKSAAGAPAPSSAMSLSLHASAAVYVCLLGEGGRKLIPGVNLQPGESTPTYHSRHFVITLGNSSVTMLLDGRTRTVAPSSQAIGYSITKANGRQALPTSQLPTCK